MASLFEDEKQLFEKFWRGTFKAVAMPRPESVIIASIAASRPVTSVSSEADISPWPTAKRKKKKKNSKQKRRRERSVKKRKSMRKQTRKQTRNQMIKPMAMDSRKRNSEKTRERQGVKRLHPGLEALNRTAIVQHSLSNQGKGHADYDSGNDTSSPPSTKTGITRAKVVGGRNVSCQELGSPEKLRFTSRDNVSDSGNSLTSYDSACEVVQAERNLPRTNLWSVKRWERRLGIRIMKGRSQCPASCPCREESRSYAAFRTLQLDVASRAARSLTQSESRSRSRTRSSRSSRYRDSDSGSRSLSSSHRSGGRRPGSSSCRKQSKRDRKWSRRRFSSPMRKRRRGSPSHLEARRITSARKRPIPYYRPSPSSSSSSRCSSLSSWSLFSLNHSRSPRRTRSSYRSYSHASSWNSAYSSRSRSRSRSYDSLAIYRRTRH
uniref:Serine/arginine repetitive matrix protein C-terminal domain-containing protein n=1 Tax=Electrophorus electricus TaxID=8005 RepID=A0A4W4FG65_ELEEL